MPEAGHARTWAAGGPVGDASAGTPCASAAITLKITMNCSQPGARHCASERGTSGATPPMLPPPPSPPPLSPAPPAAAPAPHTMQHMPCAGCVCSSQAGQPGGGAAPPRRTVPCVHARAAAIAGPPWRPPHGQLRTHISGAWPVPGDYAVHAVAGGHPGSMGSPAEEHRLE
eukprot:157849-Chlamydomonas_euryale.AAC.1